MSQTAELSTIEDARPLPAPRRRGWGRYVVWVFLFATGVFSGAMGAVIVLNDRMDDKIRHPDRWSRDMVASMKSELDLTDEQTDQVKEIVRQHHEEIGKIWAEMGPRFRDALKTMGKQVDSVLTPEQQQKWHDWLETRRRRVCPNSGDASSHKPGANDQGDWKRLGRGERGRPDQG